MAATDASSVVDEEHEWRPFVFLIEGEKDFDKASVLDAASSGLRHRFSVLLKDVLLSQARDRIKATPLEELEPVLSDLAHHDQMMAGATMTGTADQVPFDIICRLVSLRIARDRLAATVQRSKSTVEEGESPETVVEATSVASLPSKDEKRHRSRQKKEESQKGSDDRPASGGKRAARKKDGATPASEAVDREDYPKGVDMYYILGDFPQDADSIWSLQRAGIPIDAIMCCCSDEAREALFPPVAAPVVQQPEAETETMQVDVEPVMEEVVVEEKRSRDRKARRERREKRRGTVVEEEEKKEKPKEEPVQEEEERPTSSVAPAVPLTPQHFFTPFTVTLASESNGLLSDAMWCNVSLGIPIKDEKRKKTKTKKKKEEKRDEGTTTPRVDTSEHEQRTMWHRDPAKLWDDIVTQVYSVVKRKMEYRAWLCGVRVIDVPDFVEPDERVYKRLTSQIPVSAVSPALLLHCILEQVCTDGDDECDEHVATEAPADGHSDIVECGDEAVDHHGVLSEYFDTALMDIDHMPASPSVATPTVTAPKLVHAQDTVGARLIGCPQWMVDAERRMVHMLGPHGDAVTALDAPDTVQVGVARTELLHFAKGLAADVVDRSLTLLSMSALLQDHDCEEGDGNTETVLAELGAEGVMDALPIPQNVCDRSCYEAFDAETLAVVYSDRLQTHPHVLKQLRACDGSTLLALRSTAALHGTTEPEPSEWTAHIPAKLGFGVWDMEPKNDGGEVYGVPLHVAHVKGVDKYLHMTPSTDVTVHDECSVSVSLCESGAAGRRRVRTSMRVRGSVFAIETADVLDVKEDDEASHNPEHIVFTGSYNDGSCLRIHNDTVQYACSVTGRSVTVMPDGSIRLRPVTPAVQSGVELGLIPTPSICNELCRDVFGHGSVLKHMIDGSLMVLFANGNVSSRGSDGQWHIVNADGVRVKVDMDGHKSALPSLRIAETTDPETGTVTRTREDMVDVVRSLDDVVTVRHADGTVIVTHPNRVVVQCTGYPDVVLHSTARVSVALGANTRLEVEEIDGGHAFRCLRPDAPPVRLSRGVVTVFGQAQAIAHDRGAGVGLIHCALDTGIVQTVDRHGLQFTIGGDGTCAMRETGAGDGHVDDDWEETADAQEDGTEVNEEEKLETVVHPGPSQLEDSGAVVPPVLLVVHADGSGGEFLRTNDVQSDIDAARLDPNTLVLTESVGSEEGSVAITMLVKNGDIHHRQLLIRPTFSQDAAKSLHDAVTQLVAYRAQTRERDEALHGNHDDDELLGVIDHDYDTLHRNLTTPDAALKAMKIDTVVDQGDADADEGVVGLEESGRDALRQRYTQADRKKLLDNEIERLGRPASYFLSAQGQQAMEESRQPIEQHTEKGGAGIDMVANHVSATRRAAATATTGVSRVAALAEKALVADQYVPDSAVLDLGHLEYSLPKRPPRSTPQPAPLPVRSPPKKPKAAPIRQPYVGAEDQLTASQTLHGAHTRAKIGSRDGVRTGPCFVAKPSDVLNFDTLCVGKTYTMTLSLTNVGTSAARLQHPAVNPAMSAIADVTVMFKLGPVAAGMTVKVPVRLTAKSAGQVSLPLPINAQGLEHRVSVQANILTPNDYTALAESQHNAVLSPARIVHFRD